MSASPMPTLAPRQTGRDSSGCCLELSEYDRDLCKRLALSHKTESAVKRMARLLLEMYRIDSLQSVSQRSGVPVHTLAVLRQRYANEGLQEVLQTSLPQSCHPAGGKVALTQAERAFCEHVVASQEGSKGRLRRAKALLLLDEGRPKSSIVGITHACGRTLERLIDRYQTHGAEGAVNDAERSGRPVRYPKEEFVPLIQQVIEQERPRVLMNWTLGDLRQCLARHRQEAAGMSMPTLRALVHGAGFSFRAVAKN